MKYEKTYLCYSYSIKLYSSVNISVLNFFNLYEFSIIYKGKIINMLNIYTDEKLSILIFFVYSKF